MKWRESDAVTVLLALFPWPAVAIGLYAFHNVWAAFVLYHGLCLAAWAAARSPLSRSPIRWGGAQWAWLSATCIAVNSAAYLACGLLAALIDPGLVQNRLRQLHVAPGLLGELPLIAYFALVNPIAEELFWRATIYGRLRANGRSAASSAIVSGILFGAWHFVPVSLLLGPTIAVPAVFGIGLAGVFLAVFYERVRATPPLMLLHGFGADVPVLLVFWMDVLAKR